MILSYNNDMFDEFIDNEKDNIVKTLSELIKYESVSIEDEENKDFPFGKECTNVLNRTLEIAKDMGFKTKNLDNYCGYIEFGEGKDIIGITGHLDVVPANMEDGWTNNPFSPTIENNKLFGRGAIDDKGPVVAALYAMKAVLKNANVNKRIRLILGLNEEKNWNCINHYKEIEEMPVYSFSPDSNFPVIYAEKGIMPIELVHPFSIKNAEILNIDCKNNAINVVPKYCSITLKFDKTISNLNTKNDIEIEKINDNTIKIISTGIASHSARLEKGKNAITNLLQFLLENFETDKYLQDLFDLKFFDIYSPQFLSEKNIEDESGILTSNVSVLRYENNNLIIQTDLRVPVKTKLDDIEEKYLNLKNIFPKLEVSALKKQEPLYVNKESYLVKTLINIYNAKTNSKAEPIAIGGGTFARAFDNSVAFGLAFPGDPDMCHTVDEYVDIDKLILGAKIYAEAIYELSK